MGEARRRRQEIAEIKKWGGRLMDTPRFDSPPWVRVGDQVWLITRPEFAEWVEAAHQIPSADSAQQEFARLALIAERSGTKEAECQQWFGYQLKSYADARLDRPVPPPIVFAQSSRQQNPNQL